MRLSVVAPVLLALQLAATSPNARIGERIPAYEHRSPCPATSACVCTRPAVAPASSFAPERVRNRLQLGPRHPDPWFAEDKLRHFFTAMAVTGFGSAGARSVGFARDEAAVAGALGAAIASVGKEIHDRRTGTFVSARDLVWDAAGIAMGIALVSATR